MIIGSHDTDKQVLIVAEIGNNHEGDYALAEEMIGRAAQAGAHAVKFQTIVPDRLVSPRDEARVQQLSKFQFSPEEFEKLSQVAQTEGIMFLSTPFDLESARFLDGLVPAFKIASGDNNFFPLIEVVARTGKPILLSAGMTDAFQIEKTRGFIEKVWRQERVSPGLALLHCVVSYPAEPHDANLLAIRQLQKPGVTVGYSDHTIGTEAAVASVALGARVIEKHFTVDKHYSDFRDHQLSADPQDLAQLVERIKALDQMLGEGGKQIWEVEKENAVKMRRSIVAGQDLPQGHRLEWEDLSWTRPGEGLSPGEENRVLGKRLERHLQRGEPILLDDIV